MCAQLLSHIQLSASTVACQVPLSMSFFREEYLSGLLFPVPEDLPNPGFEPTSLALPALARGFFTTEPPGKLLFWTVWNLTYPTAIKKWKIGEIYKRQVSAQECDF